LPGNSGLNSGLNSQFAECPHFAKKRKAQTLFKEYSSTLLIPDRVRLNTAHVTSIFIFEPVLSNIFYSVKLKRTSENRAKALCLWLNTTWGATNHPSQQRRNRGRLDASQNGSLEASSSTRCIISFSGKVSAVRNPFQRVCGRGMEKIARTIHRTNNTRRESSSRPKGSENPRTRHKHLGNRRFSAKRIIPTHSRFVEKLDRRLV